MPHDELVGLVKKLLNQQVNQSPNLASANVPSNLTDTTVAGSVSGNGMHQELFIQSSQAILQGLAEQIFLLVKRKRTRLNLTCVKDKFCQQLQKSET